MPMLAEVKHMRTAEVSHGFEPRSLDSESRVLLTVTPQVTTHGPSALALHLSGAHLYHGCVDIRTGIACHKYHLVSWPDGSCIGPQSRGLQVRVLPESLRFTGQVAAVVSYVRMNRVRTRLQARDRRHVWRCPSTRGALARCHMQRAGCA